MNDPIVATQRSTEMDENDRLGVVSFSNGFDRRSWVAPVTKSVKFATRKTVSVPEGLEWPDSTHWFTNTSGATASLPGPRRVPAVRLWMTFCGGILRKGRLALQLESEPSLRTSGRSSRSCSIWVVILVPSTESASGDWGGTGINPAANTRTVEF